MKNEKFPEIKHMVMDGSDPFMNSAIGISAIDYKCPDCEKDIKAGSYVRVHQWIEEDRYCICGDCDIKTYCGKDHYMEKFIKETIKHVKEGTVPTDISKTDFIEEVMGKE